MNFLLFVYQIIYFFGVFISLPKLLYECGVKRRKWRSLLARMGVGVHLPRLKESPVIWIHAVSLGETKVAATLTHEIRKMNPNAQFVISSITETGHEEAIKSIPEAAAHLFLPFDFTFLLQPLLKKLSPELLIFIETDFWWNFIRLAKRHGARLVLVNGKVSQRSARRFASFPSIVNTLFRPFDLFCIQNQTYAERFAAMGIDAEAVRVTGNIKLDTAPQELDEKEKSLLRQQLCLSKDALLIVAGSTHDPEENLLIKAMQPILERHPRTRLLLVPRHPERFHQVKSLLTKSTLPHGSFSEKERLDGSERVILIDAMGVLKQYYQVAAIAIVAGSFTPKVGGHNILEPCWYGIPVIFGPHMFGQPELHRLALQYKAGKEVAAGHLTEAVEDLLSNPEHLQALAEGGLKLIKENRGAVKKTLDELAIALFHPGTSESLQDASAES